MMGRTRHAVHLWQQQPSFSNILTLTALLGGPGVAQLIDLASIDDAAQPELLAEQAPAETLWEDDPSPPPDDGEAHIVGPHSVCPRDAPQYSGHIPAGGGARYFFWLAHSRSSTPEKDPLLLWLNGGPGCSSTLALLFENGPCLVSRQNGSQYLNLTRNPWSWTEAANTVWVDQPAGVGFSHGPQTGGGFGTEQSVADHMIVFLNNFYEHFPRFADVPLFIFGESFAGHYIPDIARLALKKQREGKFNAKIRLGGIALGNGLVVPWPQMDSKPDMAYTGGKGGSLGRGKVSFEQYEAMESKMSSCHKGIQNLPSELGLPQNEQACSNTFSDCLFPLRAIRENDVNPYDMRQYCPKSRQPLCYDFSPVADFLNYPAIQKALGLTMADRWQICNMNIVSTFIRTCDWLTRYDWAVVELLGEGVPVLIYNGDTDFMCDWIGSKVWAMNLKWPHRSEFVTTNDVPIILDNVSKGMERSARGLTFLQLYDSGHLVPTDQPELALAMVREFLSPQSRWAMPPGDSAPYAPAADVSKTAGPSAPIIPGRPQSSWPGGGPGGIVGFPPLVSMVVGGVLLAIIILYALRRGKSTSSDNKISQGDSAAAPLLPAEKTSPDTGIKTFNTIMDTTA